MGAGITASAGLPSRFRIVDALGSGAFGAVYEAVDARSGQRVALKVLDDVSAESLARFKHEFRALADCHHPNLVSLKELIEEAERWIIVMELVPGADFLSFVRVPADNDNQRFHEGRLRSALSGVCRGLTALHGLGVLHRDLKPSNVRVTPEGRAVLLDFGLVTSADPMQQSTHGHLLGTVPYMAPEQATRASVGPPADWYAFGVCLFEALTDARPFEGETPFELLLKKQSAIAPRASSLVPGVPSDLDDLCARLLERDPDLRAGAAEVAAALGVGRGGDTLSEATTRTIAGPAPFAGREPELRQLARALSRVEQGSLRFVLVEGESGVGKSELVAEFLRRSRRKQPNLLTLAGRCYENEQVSYKAFDGCIDELATFLARLPEASCARLLPPRATLLGQLFPTLRGVRAIATAPESDPSADPSARRLEAFAALAALLRKLSDERSVVLVIDDLQWADAESFRLLLALMDEPEPPPVLIVATVRPPEELEPEVRAGLESLRRRQRMDAIAILGLPSDEAMELARELLGPDASDEDCRVIAAESGGHPLFLSELARYARSRDLAQRGGFTLEAALRARMERLDPRARALLELVALAARPHGRHVFARALGVAEVEDAARTLLSAKLLRVRKHQELGTFHDRIRHTAVALIAKSRLPALHRQLARALAEDPESDTFEQAQHWDLAGDEERALEAYAQAAESAYQALAFLRAADLSARALALLGDERSEQAHRLMVLEADALACAGRSMEAAARYRLAAARARGVARYVLRARHAEQLLLSARFEEGIEAMRGVLRQLGVRLPTTMLGTLAQVAVYKAWLALRGHRYVPREAKPGEEMLELTSDVLSTFSHAISPIHPPVLLLMTLRLARFAPRLPRPKTLLRLYSALGWLYAIGGSARRSEQLFERAHALVGRTDDVAGVGHALLAEGSARLMNWELSLAAVALEQAQTLLQTRCPDQPALRRNIRYHLGTVWYALGRFSRLASEAERWINEARERNDALTAALVIGMGYGFVRHLMRDAPDAALDELDATMRELPAEPFSFVQLGALVARATTLLYQGGPAAHEWLEAHVEARPKPFLLRSIVGRQRLRVMRAQAALRALEGAEPAQRRALVAIAEKSARKLARERTILRTHGLLLRAQLEALSGRPERARMHAHDARQAASGEAGGTLGILACYLEALLETGRPEHPRCTAVLDMLAAEGFERPLSFLTAMLPALGELVPTMLASAKVAEATLLDRYEVVRPLAGGGFGSVVEAIDTRSGRPVALKELVSKHPRSLERFKREFRVLSDVHHPNLAHLEALFEHGGTWYIAMELLRGEPLVAYCRPHGLLDEARLRRAFAGVCDGLAALHEAGFAHRDVTPDNVVVTEDGRPVLIDFGLIGRLDDRREPDPSGTVEYAAPEQLDGAPASPEVDVYALGTCLYQALSGALPFTAEVPALLVRKKRSSAPEPLRVAGHEELATLALEMLSREPRRRPTLAAVRARLTGSTTSSETPPVVVQPSVPFSGREVELGRLQDAFERTCDDGLSLVLIEGESGVGKSSLMREFGRLTAARTPNAVVLHSRCYEGERVALKAFDGAVDQLAGVLRELPNPSCEALLPKHAVLLPQLFPVLGGVPAIAESPKRGIPADLGQRQRTAIACFVELLSRLCRELELLILIDDLQWADPESFRLLRMLYERRAELPLLVVCTVRPSTELPAEVATDLATLEARPGSEVLALAGLSEAAATRMIVALTGGSPAPERVARLLAEAKGHPLFLRELIEQERSGSRDAGKLTLDAALERRIQRFDPAARTLLSLVALAGKPYEAHLFARAMHGAVGYREAVAALLGRGILRYSGGNALIVQHDRVAQAARALLSTEQTRRLATDLAGALESEPRTEAADRARLWDLAGDVRRAAAAYREAAEQALTALRFRPAAQLYARALELMPEADEEDKRALLERRGDALARAGQSAEAADAYRAAAQGAEGHTSARLRTLAVAHAIRSAQAPWALSEARALLAELGIVVPVRPEATLVRVALNRALASLRRHELRRHAAPIAPRIHMQLEAAWALAMPISWLDPLAGAAVATRYVRIALASGDPLHMARALAAEAFARSVHGEAPRQKKVDALLERARALAVRSGDPALAAEIDFRDGSVATYRWQLDSARELLERALLCVTERCPDQPWLTTHIRLVLGAVRYSSAEHEALARASAAWLADACDRGDEFALTTLFSLGYGFINDLMADAPERALEHVAEKRHLWPTQPFSFVHFGELLAVANSLVYRGGPLALAWFERELPRLRRARLLRFETGRATFLSMYAQAALAAWTEARGDRARALLAIAHARVAELSRERNALAVHMAPFLRAQLWAAEGEPERALVSARRVRAAAHESSFFALARSAAYLEALLEGGQRGSELRAELLSSYAAQGWKRPERALGLPCPVIARLGG